MHCFVSMYLSKRKGFFFFQRSVFILKAWYTSVPCIVGALSNVLFFFPPTAEYQFVLGIYVSSTIQ